MMQIQLKHEDEDGNYIEIDLEKSEIENLSKGRYPSNTLIINGKNYTVSIGIVSEQ